MTEISHLRREAARRPTPLPWGVLGMFGLMLLVEHYTARHDLDFTRLIPANWRASGRAASRQAETTGVLCFGDSQVKLGVLPGVVEAGLGRPCYNLALHGGQAPAGYFLLRRALRSGARPSALVVGYYPALLAVDPEINLRQWPELLNLSECLDLAWTARDPRLLASTLLGLLLPTVRCRQEIRAGALAALGAGARPDRDDVLAARRNWRVNRGAQPAARKPQFVDDLAALGDANRPSSHRWKCKRVNFVYLERFLDLAALHRIPVYWVMPILSPSLQATRNRNGLDAETTRFVRSLQTRFPNLVAVDGRRAGYDRSLFIDPVHLDHRGALALSTELGRIASCDADRSHSAARWVEMTPFRNSVASAVSALAVEDLDESRLAVRLRGGPTRD